MSEPTDAEDRDEIAGMAPPWRRALKVVIPAQSSGAASIGSRPSAWRHRFPRGDHVFGVAAVVVDAGPFFIDTIDEITRRHWRQVKSWPPCQPTPTFWPF
jgi:hypothetical protein